MSYGLGLLLFVLLVAQGDAIGVEAEQFTLADGRVLVGTYDKKTGLLSFSGAIKGAVPVKEEDIVSREPAQKPAAKPVEKPVEKPVGKPEKEASNGEGEGEKAVAKLTPAAVDPNKILIEQQTA